jgi:hypothetical protein
MAEGSDLCHPLHPATLGSWPACLPACREEDSWRILEVASAAAVGGAKFLCVKPCSRCTVNTIGRKAQSTLRLSPLQY